MSWMESQMGDGGLADEGRRPASLIERGDPPKQVPRRAHPAGDDPVPVITVGCGEIFTLAGVMVNDAEADLYGAIGGVPDLGLGVKSGQEN